MAFTFVRYGSLEIASIFALSTSIPEPAVVERTTKDGDPPFPAPSQSTSANHTEGEIKKEGYEGVKRSIIQEPVPRPSIFYQPSKSSNLPFPSRLKKQKKDDEDKRLLLIFKQIHINLPFLEAMIHMPKGANVLKDLLSHTEKLEKSASSVKLSEECSVIIQRSVMLLSKEGDPGSFTLLCLIGPLAVKNALADLGASINLMPHSLFRRLGISKLKPTKMSIQPADRSINTPSGSARIYW
ncbi:reverse transcriptase domain-containing protein [Tanacetum coccineum]